MKNYIIYILILFSHTLTYANNFKGRVLNEQTNNAIANVTIINLSNYESTTSLSLDGSFSIQAKIGDEIQFVHSNYIEYKLTLTEDWFTIDVATIYLEEQIEVLEELVISNLKLTGVLDVDSHLIAFEEYPYTRDLSITPYTKYNSFNPIGNLYQVLKNKSSQMKKINALKKENKLLELMKERYDRELVAGLLQVSKERIIDILRQKRYSESFIHTASDHQIFIAYSNSVK